MKKAFLKKAVTVVAVLVMGCAFLSAQADTAAAEKTEESKKVQVQTLLDGGLKKNGNEINAASADLTMDEKQELYKENKKTTALPFGLNLLVGFGSGSYVQGDITGGVIASCGDLAGWALLMSTNGKDGMDSVMSALGGVVTLLGFRIFEVIRPFSYAGKYNDNLAHTLGVYSVSTNFLPTVTTDGNLQLAIATKINF